MNSGTVVELTFDDRFMTLHLQDGRRMSIPMSWYPAIQDAPAAVRQGCEFFKVLDSQFLRWPALDVTLSTEALLTTPGPIRQWDLDGPDDAMKVSDKDQQ